MDIPPFSFGVLWVGFFLHCYKWIEIIKKTFGSGTYQILHILAIDHYVQHEFMSFGFFFYLFSHFFVFPIQLKASNPHMRGEEMYKMKGVVGTIRGHLLDPSIQWKRLWIHNHLSYQINTKEKYVFVFNSGDLIIDHTWHYSHLNYNFFIKISFI